MMINSYVVMCAIFVSILINPFLRRTHGSFAMSHIRVLGSVGIKNKTKTLEVQKELSSGCSWCRSGERPVFQAFTTELIFAGEQLYRYSGQEICGVCVKSFKQAMALTAWRKLRQSLLAEQPYCTHCHYLQLLTKDTLGLRFAGIVDHKLPWRYYPDLFWQEENLQPLCWRCHNQKTYAERQAQN
jgi:hypothetical protein